MGRYHIVFPILALALAGYGFGVHSMVASIQRATDVRRHARSRPRTCLLMYDCPLSLSAQRTEQPNNSLKLTRRAGAQVDACPARERDVEGGRAARFRRAA